MPLLPTTAPPRPLARLLGGVTVCAAVAAALVLPTSLAAAATAAPTCLGVTATIVGTIGPDTLTGTPARDVIWADAGNDSISGLAGDDLICGADGDDTVTGGVGADTLDGGAGWDTVNYGSETTPMTVNLAAGTATGSVVGTDRLSTVEKVIGGSAADRLTGNGSGNTLVGGAGNDVLDASTGWDTCEAGTGDDTLAGCESVTVQTEKTGAVDTATFSLPAGTRYFLDNKNTDSATTRALSWSLTSPANTAVFSRAAVAGTDAGSYPAAAGTYRVDMTGSAVGTHRWNLVVPTTQTFSTPVGATVGADSPAKGMGRLEGPQDRDVYTFTGAAGQRIYLNSISDTTGGKPTVLLTAPGGAQVLNTFLGQDRGPITLPAAGTYTLTVGVTSALDTVGTYGFALRDVPAAQTFSAPIGTVISDGKPAAGAGRLEASGSADVYTFTGAAGQQVYLDALSDSVSGDATLVLTAPNGATVLNTFVEVDSRPVTLPVAGTYSMTVRMPDNDARTGTYSLVLRAVGGATQSFPYTLGSTVSPNVPGAGAGNLEATGAKDEYTFAGTAGQVLFYDSLADATANYGFVTLVAPSGAKVLESWIAYDRGRIVLPATGTYTLRVETTDTAHSGTYSFRLSVVPAEQKFALTMGSAVSDGVPAIGAGNLEAVGSADRYTFTASAGQKVTYDYLSDSTAGYAQVTILDPNGGQVVNKWIAGDATYTLPTAGTYSLLVNTGRDDQHTGTYSFRLVQG